MPAANIEDLPAIVLTATPDSGPHGGGLRVSFKLWNEYEGAPQAALDLYQRLFNLVADATTPEEKALMQRYGFAPVLHAPTSFCHPQPSDEWNSAAIVLCERRALLMYPGRKVQQSWPWAMNGDHGVSVVLVGSP